MPESKFLPIQTPQSRPDNCVQTLAQRTMQERRSMWISPWVWYGQDARVLFLCQIQWVQNLESIRWNSFNDFAFSQVLVTTKNALSYTLTLKQRSKIVLGMIVASAVMGQRVDTVMFDVITILSYREITFLKMALMFQVYSAWTTQQGSVPTARNANSSSNNKITHNFITSWWK